MRFDYDDANLFAKILRGEIPNDTVLETELSLAFRDIHPQAPSHVLIIPKGKYVTYDDFAAHASDAEIVDFHRVVAQVTQSEGLSIGNGGQGFRALTNAGPHGMQEVPHFHMHLLGGRALGPILNRPSDG